MRAANHHRSGRLRRLPLLVIALIATAICASVVVPRALGRGLLPTTTTLSITNSDGSALQTTTDSSGDTVYVVPSGTSVSLTANVSDTSGIAPAGPVTFQNNQLGAFANMNSVSLAALTGSSSSGTYTTMLPVGTYQLQAVYGSNVTQLLNGSNSAPVFVQVTSSVDFNTVTQLTASPSPVQTSQPTTLTATVSATFAGAPTPTGTVTFYSTSGGGYFSLIGTAQLVNGVATTTTVFGAAQMYTLVADYGGAVSNDNLGNRVQYFTSSGQVNLSVNPQPGAIPTATNITLSAPVIRAGTPVSITAHVSQTGSPLSSVDGTVEFFAAPVDASGYPVALGSGSLDQNNNATLTVPNGTYTSAWLPGTYIITASYVGDVANSFAGSSAQTELVVDQAVSTTTTYLHDHQTYVGTTATLSAQVTASNGQGIPIGELVTLTASDAASTGCIGAVDANGIASCTVSFPAAGTFQVTASYPGDAGYNPSVGLGQIEVDMIPTTTTSVGDSTDPSGAQATLAGHLVDNLTGLPIPNAALTLVLNNNETCSGTTDANGNASCQVTVSEGPGSYQVTASYAGSAKYYPSSGSSPFTVTGLQPTHLTYVGDTTALAGQPATIAFRLTDDFGRVMANRQVTLTLNGQTYTDTTNANGVASQPVTAPATAGPYTPTADFGGGASVVAEPGYYGSDGSGSLVVSTIPTTTTYVGTTSVYGGQPANIAFQLTDPNGAPIVGKTLTLTLPDGSTYTGTTDANGIVSKTITAPTPGAQTSYPVSASFAGSLPYLASSGPGNLTVNVIPTNITYTGTTSAYGGQPATISFVLKSSIDGSVLPNMPVTLTLPDGSHYSTTTDANGVASKTVSAPLATGNYPVSESFGGQAQYLPSTGTGNVAVTAIPTTVTYVGDTSVYQGGTATLAAKLVASTTGLPLANEPVTLTMSTGETCTGTTNALGIASCQVVVNEPTTLAGSPYPIAISFKGDPPYLPSTGTGAIAVVAQYAAPAAGFCSGHKCESLIANPTIVSPTQLQILYADDSALPTSASLAPTAVLDNGQQLVVSVVPTSGVGAPPGALSYVDTYGGSTSTKNEDYINVKLPSGLAAGQHTVRFFVYDGDGDWDQWTWTFQVGGDGTVTTLNTGPGPVTCGGAVHCESILADPKVVSNSQLSIVATDDSPIGTVGSTAPSAVLSTGQILTVSTSATSGQPLNYVDKNGGSTAATYQTLLTINLPSGLAAGSYTIRVTAYDGDGDLDQWNWPITVASNGTVTSGSGPGNVFNATTSSIAQNFNGSTVPAGDSLWFSSIVHVSGVPATGATITAWNQTITLGSTTITVPESQIVFSPSATVSTTTYSGGVWTTTVPYNLGANVFSAGVVYQLPAALAANLKNVTWSGTFGSSVAGVTVNWGWSAAAYSSFGSDLGSLGVKATDDAKTTGNNNDKAGTAENYKSCAVAGGTGNGGTNYTGNLSPQTAIKF